MDKKLSLLLSGPGLIGSKHAQLIAERSDLDLVAVVAPPAEDNAEFARAYGAHFHHSMQDAFQAHDIDAALICSPNEYHHAQAMDCIAHKVPVLVEKPLTGDIAEARDLVEAAEQSDHPVLVGHHRTYSPLLLVARDFMGSDDFGKLVCVQGSALFYKPDDYFEDGPWRTKKGGGPILINMIHEIGIMRHLCGEITSVSATLSSAKRGFEVEDSAAILLNFEGGAIGTFLLSDAVASSKSWEMTAGENPAYPYFPNQDCYHFAGDNGSLDFPSMQTRSYTGTPDQSWWHGFTEARILVERQDPVARQLDHFVDVIRKKVTPVVTARDGYANMLVLEAIVEAAAHGTVVQIAECEAQLAGRKLGAN